MLVDDERIVALAAPGSEVATAFAEGARRIDASGKFVVPGAVDVHTHMEMPFGGTQSADTFESGTRAAAWGGTTTIVDFAIQRKGEPLRSGLDAWHAKADGNCAVDYGFHMIVSDVNDQSCKEMDVLVGEGVTSFKLFMAYPGVFYSTDGDILRAMQQARASGATVMMHAENGIAIDVLVSQALSRGETAPRFHGITRPDRLEAEATGRAIALAKVAGAPSTSSICPPPALSKPSPRRGGKDRTPSPRPARSTCSFRRTTSPARASKGPSTSARRRFAPRSTRPTCGEGSAPTTCRSCRPIIARSVSRSRRSLGLGDFSKIPNGIPGVEHRVDLTYPRRASAERSPSLVGSRSTPLRPPGCSGCTPARGCWHRGRTPISSCTTRRRPRRSRPRRTT